MSGEEDRMSVVEYWKADSAPDGVPVVRAVEDDGDEDGALAMTGTLEDAEFIAAALNDYRGAVAAGDDLAATVRSVLDSLAFAAPEMFPLHLRRLAEAVDDYTSGRP